jgi:hypothetical protein
MSRTELEALQREWSHVLWTRIEQLALDPSISDEGELARRAWADCAATYPHLRRQLDAHRDQFDSTPFRARAVTGTSFVA